MQINTGYPRKINKHQEAKCTIVDKLYFFILTKQSAGKLLSFTFSSSWPRSRANAGRPKVSHYQCNYFRRGGRKAEWVNQFKAGQLQFPELWQQLEHPGDSFSGQSERRGWRRQNPGNWWDTKEQLPLKPEMQQVETQQEEAGGPLGGRHGAGARGPGRGHLGGHLGESWRFCFVCWEDILVELRLS